MNDMQTELKLMHTNKKPTRPTAAADSKLSPFYNMLGESLHYLNMICLVSCNRFCANFFARSLDGHGTVQAKAKFPPRPFTSETKSRTHLEEEDPNPSIADIIRLTTGKSSVDSTDGKSKSNDESGKLPCVKLNG